MSGYYLLQKGEFAYNKSYSVGYDFGSIKRLESYENGALSTLYICFSLKKCSSDFMKQYFDSLKWYREIYKISAEGARNHGLLNVPTDDFFNTIHILPKSIDEQSKIADFLKKINLRISKQKELVENLKKYKRGLISLIFSNDSTWEKNILGNLVTIQRGGSPRPINEYITQSDSGLNWIKIGDVSPDSLYINSTKEKILPSGLRKTRQVKIGDLILSNSMSFGRPYILQIDGCIHDGWLLIRDEKQIFDKLFLCYYLGSELVSEQYKKFASGSCVNNLNSELVSSVEIAYPNISSQKKIAKTLIRFEQKINIELQEYEYLLKVKTNMLQELFI